MKKVLAILLVLVMALGLFAGCADTPDDQTSSTIAEAKEYLYSLYKDTNGASKSADFEMVQQIKINSDIYPIEWTVAGGDDLITIEKGELYTTIKVGKNYGEDAVEFTLTATISDGNGNTEAVSFTYSIPTSPKLPEGDAVLYFPNDGQYVTLEGYTYTSSSGTVKEELVLTTDRDSAAVFQCKTNDDGSISLVTADGKYLYADGTDVKWVDAADSKGYTNFIVEAAEGGMYLKCATASYNGNAQYLEVYSGYLTCYSFSDSKTYLYIFQMLGKDEAACAHEHTEVLEGKAATCTEDGLTEGLKCTDCGVVITAQETIAAGHSWSDWAVKEDDATKLVRTCSVCNETEEKDKPASEWVVADAPEAGVAYKLGMYQGNLDANYYITGEMSGYYMATVEDPTAAADVYLEATEGGYYLYCIVGEAKLYINMVVSGTYVNGAYEETASTVYTYDATNNWLVATVNDAEYAIGTRNDKEYSTVGPVKTSYNGFHCQLYVEQEAKEITSIADANAIGAAKDHNTYTEDKYYVTGVITEVYNATYGNMYITDGNGNTLTVYGTYDADGSNRYDAMANAPVAGDTVTVYGVLGQYNGNPQMKNGWIVEIVAGEPAEEPVVVEKDETVTPGADYTYTAEKNGTLTVTVVDGIWNYNGYEIHLNGYNNYTLADYFKGGITGTLSLYINGEDVLLDATNEYEIEVAAGDTVTIKVVNNYANAGDYTLNITSIDLNLSLSYLESENEADNPVDPDPVDPDPVDPEPTVTIPYEVGKAYKYSMYAKTLDKTLYALGEMSGYYMATTEDASAAVDVYLEEVDGGYRIYFLSGETKTYIDLVASGSYVNISLTTTPTQVWVYDADLGIFVSDVNGTNYYLGTYYNSNKDTTYTTVSASKTSYITSSNLDETQFPLRLTEVEAGSGSEEGGIAAFEGSWVSELQGNKTYYLDVVDGVINFYYQKTNSSKATYLVTDSTDYTVEGNVLSIPVYAGTSVFTLNDGVLSLVDSNQGWEFTLTKAGSGEGSDPVEEEPVDTAPFVGTWYNADYTLVINADGTGSMTDTYWGDVYDITYTATSTGLTLAYTWGNYGTLYFNTDNDLVWYYYGNETIFSDTQDSGNTGDNYDDGTAWKFEGTWSADVYGYTYVLTINADGTATKYCVEDDYTDDFTWTCAESVLTLYSYGYEMGSCTVNDDGDSLFYDDGYGNEITYEYGYEAEEEEAAVGTYSNPYVIETEGEYTVTVSEDSCYYITYTPATSGTLTLTVNGLTGYNEFFIMDDDYVLYKFGDADTTTISGDVVAGVKYSIGIYANGEISVTLSVAEPVKTPTQIMDAANALETGASMDAECTLTGVITIINTPYSSSHGNISVTILVDGDESNRSILCYRLKGDTDVSIADLKVGDTITVTGTIMNYNGTIEFGKDCICSVIVEGEPEEVEGNVLTISISDYADANSWENATQYATISADDFTVTASGTDQNTGKYYTSGEQWRLYQVGAATLTIAAPEGKTILSVKVTYVSEKNGILVDAESNTVSSGVSYEVNASSVVLTVSNSGTATNGQARVTAIEIVYE